MKTIKQISAALLVVLALAVFSVTSQAQTTNRVVNPFNTAAEVTNSTPWNGTNNGWGNWFGNAWVANVWDPAVDSSNNPSSGSLKVTTTWKPATNGNYYQYVEFDGFGTINCDMYNVFSNLSFDIKYDASSCKRTNADGTVDFGWMRAGAWDNWQQDWFYYFAIPATNALGGPNTNWTHISITIDTNTFVTWPHMTNITDILFGMDGGAPGFGNTNLSGNQIYWVDNIQFIGPVGGIVHPPPPPPTMSIQKATPALRNFVGSASIYARSQLTSVDQNQSWIGGGTTYPVSYSFTLLSAPNVNQVQTHIELVPVNHAAPPGVTGHTGLDWDSTNVLWLQILGDGAGGYTAVVAWKTNAPSNNPNHTELSIASSHSPVGTWTLRFNSATTGSLTAPGVSATNFTITDPNVAADFGNPCVVVFGNQPNGVNAAEGQPEDYAAISVTGVAGFHENENFTTAPSISAYWDLSNSDDTNTLILVTTNTLYWVNWTLPDVSFGLAVSPTVRSGPWHLPEFYNGYYDLPIITAQGAMRWALIPSDCLPLPIVGGVPQIGQPHLPNAFFRLSNPPPAN